MPAEAKNLLAELLEIARGLSLDVPIMGIVFGLLLWILGWRLHRFWIVTGITICAGIVGLVSGQQAGLQVLAVGLMLAVLSGLIALHLARILAVGGAGLAVAAGVDSIAPNFNEPLLCFLAGGLLGVILFRLFTMLMTSFCGAALVAGSAMLIAEKCSSSFNAANWVNDHPRGVFLALAFATLLGVGGQSLIERFINYRKAKKQAKRKSKSKSDDGEARRAA